MTVLLTWHQHAKVGTRKKEEKLVAWLAIVNRGRVPPSFEQWTNDDDAKLLEVQSDIVEMAHMALAHLEELKKKELVLAAMRMMDEEFQKLAANRNALIVDSAASGDDHPNFDALSPARQPINDWTQAMNTGNKASSDTSGNGGGVWGVRRGFSSDNSCYKCIFMVST